MNNHKIGIIGGMGPQASRYFYQLLTDYAVSMYAVRSNHEFPYTHLISLPVPDFISNSNSTAVAKDMILDAARSLKAQGCDIICMTCNTAHILTPDISSVIGDAFVSMPACVVDVLSVDNHKPKKILLLATPTTYRMGIYQDLHKLCEVVDPSDAEKGHIEKIIRDTIAGSTRESITFFDDLITKYNPDTVVLGCTELPLVFATTRSHMHIVSSLDALARVVLSRYYKQESI